MKVFHLISSSGLLGAERVLLEIAEYSKQEGLKVEIGVFQNTQNPNLELAEEARGQGFDVTIFPCHGRLDENTIQMLKNYMRHHEIQILHSHNYKSNFYAWRALNNNVRWVVTHHGRRSGIKLSLYNLLNTYLIRKADRTVAVSKEISKKMRRAKMDPNKICLIENGVNLDRFQKNIDFGSIKESLGIKKGVPVVGTVGALTKEKGHMILLNAARKVNRIFPQAIFLFVGDGRERLKLENVAYKLGIADKVIFAGMRKDVPEILSVLDVFVLPSFYEGLPMALLEAQTAKIPVIATRVGAIPDVVEDGVTGILVPPKDPQSIAEAMITILSDNQFASRIAQSGFERVRDNFSSIKMAGKYLSIYKELIEGIGVKTVNPQRVTRNSEYEPSLPLHS